MYHRKVILRQSSRGSRAMGPFAGSQYVQTLHKK